MKKLLLTSLLSFCVLFAFADDKTPYLTKTFKASSVKNVDVSTSGGGISVYGGASSDAKVEVYVSGNNGNALSSSEIENRLKEYILTIKMDGNTLVCQADRKNKTSSWNWKNALSITFKVFVPTNVAANLNTSGGGIRMENLKGDLKFRTSGGGLDLAKLRGSIVGSTSGGGIKLIDCDDVVKLRTSGGGIEARDCDGEIDLSTSGGGLTLVNLNGKVDATTSGGGISVAGFSGDLNTSTSGGSINLTKMEGNVKASTSGGGISASFTNPGKYVSLTTSAGNISIDVPSGKGYNLDLHGNRVKLASNSNFKGTKKEGDVQGQLNGGGTVIKARASSGSITLN